MFHGGKLKAMPARLLSDDGKHTVIRPLAYAREDDIIAYSEIKQFPIIPCNLCGSQENLQRQHIKGMLNDWQQMYPGRIENMARALQNAVPSHLMDRELHDFTNKSSQQTGQKMDQQESQVDAGLELLSL
jgi:tRNA 2-thiocytidine biosynthesis protein TtcA